jgi:hypothetical protein
MQIRFLFFALMFKSCLAYPQGAFYTDQFAFKAACQNLEGVKQEISFSSLQPGWWSDSLTLSNVTFSGHLVARGQGDPIAIANEASLNNYDTGVPMSIHFETVALAFGADFSSLLFPYNTSNFTATITVQGGDIFNFSAAPGPGSTFFGFIEESPFTDLTFSDGGAFGIRQGTDGLPNGTYHEELIGNSYMVIGVPEPQVISLGVLGLFAFWLSRRLARTAELKRDEPPNS